MTPNNRPASLSVNELIGNPNVTSPIAKIPSTQNPSSKPAPGAKAKMSSPPKAPAKSMPKMKSTGMPKVTKDQTPIPKGPKGPPMK